ncbi:MAG: hypothetical protein Q4C91_19885 [Eubacteriales bacterium]|nr:hypothetical protein [Eubacteriales bacterium]
MARQAPFTEYEAVLLLDAYLRTVSGDASRRDAVKNCSDALRRMAINKGIEIEDAYRNTGGISFQMASMESAYRGMTITKPATKLFAETVSMYRNDRKKYEGLLKEAKLMADGKHNGEAAFMSWLSKKVSPAQLSELYLVFQEIEQQAKKAKIVKKSLYENSDVAVFKKIRSNMEQSRVFKFTHKRQMGRINAALNYLIQYSQETSSNEDTLGRNVLENSSEAKSPEIEKEIRVEDGSKKRVGKKNDRNSYYQWLLSEQHLAIASCRSYTSAVSVAEQYAAEKSLAGTRLYDVDAQEAKRTADALFADADFAKRNEDQHNRFKTAISKFLVFIGEEWVPSEEKIAPISNGTAEEIKETVDTEPFEAVLAERFPRGYRLGSSLEMKKYRRHYEEINGRELEIDADETERILRMCGIEHEGKVYSPKAMLSDELKEKLFAYIDEKLEEGRSVLYFEALFQEFSEEFLDHNIYDAEMLKAYIAYVAGGKYYIGKGYLSIEKRVSADPIDEVRTCLKEHGMPMEVDDLCKTLSHIPSDRIRALLGTHGEFVRNSKGEYFHADSFSATDEELDNIAALINEEIRKQSFISGNELYEAIKGKYPYIYERNAMFSVIGWRDALKHKLGDSFSFTGNIISGKDKELSMSDVFAAYGAEQESFTLSELLAFAENMGSTIYFDALYQNAARVSQEHFVPRDDVSFQVKQTDKALGRFCTGTYLALPEISDFGIFPEASHPWTPYLLEHYVAFHSKRYYLMHGGYNRNTVVGAMVKRENVYDSFDDLIVDVIAESGVPLQKKDVLNYLSDNGYIARRTYTGIETLMIKARAKRNKKEK